jgi:glycosyltransferase involved in cell wall biosynthesis
MAGRTLCPVEQWEGIPVFGPGLTQWSNDVVGPVAKLLNADLVVVLFDAWPLDIEEYGKLNTAVWTPIDHATVPPKVGGFFVHSGARTIAMSQHGKAALEAAGFENVPYVPHGIDTQVFQPHDQATARKEQQLPEDKFVVGMVSTNKGTQPSRKAFEVAFRAFGAFAKAVPDALLYVHSEYAGRMGGVDLRVLASHYEIPPENLWFADERVIPYPVSDETMAQLYSCFDVLSFASMGEGFGIPAIEAQACGCPVISSNFSAQRELNPFGWRVGGQLWWDDYQKADMVIPDDKQMVTALAMAMEARGNQELRDKCRQFTLQYDTDTVFEENWLPVLADLEDNLPTDEPIVV